MTDYTEKARELCAKAAEKCAAMNIPCSCLVQVEPMIAAALREAYEQGGCDVLDICA